ncbi:HAD hydrolase-like protein [Phaeobacter sp. NW0010-22]|uniref:HAD hydrolase-like protein n=1 Tax=Phaeobacter sp. NW0010-22 TaxID=3135907 RepID=UPI00333EDF59
MSNTFAEGYALEEASLGGIPPNRIAMIANTLHTDIIGGTELGWCTVLSTQIGMFAGQQVWDYCRSSLINPDWSLTRIRFWQFRGCQCPL